MFPSNHFSDSQPNPAPDLELDNAILRARVAELTAALVRAEQTIRNLGMGWLTGDAQTIAFNEAANIREALKGGTR